MKLDRTKNTLRNFSWGVIYQIVNILLPFVARTIFIKIIGEEYLGLNSLFGSILNVLNMSELGISSAIVFSMYSAIANDDQEQICALMNFYKKCYRVIGTIVFFLGSLLFPFLPYLIKGDVPADINLTLVYGINLFSTGISYFLFAYKHSIFWAFQREDMDKKVMIPVDISKYIVQILLLLMLKNYYAYIIVVPVFNIITNVIRGCLVDKYYPQYRAKGSIDKKATKKIISNVKALFITKVGGILSSSFDSLIISINIGLTILGRYNNYSYIMSSVVGFIQIFFDGLCAGIGNSLKTESRERNIEIFNELSYINNFIITVCAACFMCLYQPFMSLWLGKDFLLSPNTVVMIVVLFWFTRYQYVMITCKDAAGLWKQDQFRPLVVGCVNLILNICFAPFMGLNGILLASILATTVIGYPWLIHNTFTLLFSMSPQKFIIETIICAIKTAIIVLITYFILNASSVFVFGVFGFAIGLIICVFLSAALYIMANYKSQEFIRVKIRVYHLLRRYIK